MPNKGNKKYRKKNKNYKFNISGSKKRVHFNPNKLPDVTPTLICRLRFVKQQRIKNYLLIEKEYVQKMEAQRKEKDPKEQTFEIQ